MQTYYVLPTEFQVQPGTPVQLVIHSYHLQIFKLSLFQNIPYA